MVLSLTSWACASAEIRVLEQADAFRPLQRPNRKQPYVEGFMLSSILSNLLYAFLQGDEYCNKQMLSGPSQSTEQAATHAELYALLLILTSCTAFRREMSTGTSRCFQAPAKAQSKQLSMESSTFCFSFSYCLLPFRREMSTGTSRCFQAPAKAQSKQLPVETSASHSLIVCCPFTGR